MKSRRRLRGKVRSSSLCAGLLDPLSVVHEMLDPFHKHSLSLDTPPMTLPISELPPMVVVNRVYVVLPSYNHAFNTCMPMIAQPHDAPLPVRGE